MNASEARSLMPSFKPLSDIEYLVRYINERIKVRAEAGKDKLVLHFRVKPDAVIEHYKNHGYVVSVKNGSVVIGW
jgi:hypothetical protein